MADTARSDPLQIEASLLDSDVLGLLVTEELAGDVPASGPQLQWATHTEFPCVVRLFELNCCAILLTAAGGGGIFAVPAKSVAALDFRSRTSFRFLRGGVHRDCCRSRGPAGKCFRSSRGMCPFLARRTAAAHAVVGPNCCMGQVHRNRRKLCVVHHWVGGRGTNKSKSPSGEGAEGEKGSEAATTKRDRRPNSRQQCSLTLKISLAGWPPSKSVGWLPSRPFAVQAPRCWRFLPLRVRQAAWRYTGLGLCLEQAQAPTAFLFRSSQCARSLQKAIFLLANLSTLPKYLQSWRFWTSPETRHAFHYAPSRIPWSYRCGARDGSAGRSDHSHWRILELATSCKGAPPSPLWSFPNSAKSYLDGRRSPRRGQNRSSRTAARDLVPDLQDTRIWSEGPRPRSGVEVAAAMTVRPRRPTRRPLVTRRSFSNHRLAQ